MGSSTRKVRRVHAAAAVAACAVMLAGCAPHPPESVELDQSNVGSPGAFASVVWNAVCGDTALDAEIAQTFTAGRTGFVNRVTMSMQPIAPGSQVPFELTIRKVNPDGSPSGTVLGSGTYGGPGASDPSSVVDIPLQAPALVFEGHRYAIVATLPPVEECSEPARDDYGWSFFGSGDAYPSGRALWRGTGYNTPAWEPTMSDFYFETWMRELT